MFNSRLGFGGQILWRPNPSVSVVLNNYVGTDTLNNPDRRRLHTDDSVTVKYLDRPKAFLSKAAFSFTFDAGCESGGGVSCSGSAERPGAVLHRLHGLQPVLVREGHVRLHGRRRRDQQPRPVPRPPAADQRRDGDDRARRTSPRTPATRTRRGTTPIGFDYMPEQWITFRAEFNHRGANVPYFTGAGGITPDGGNQGAPGSVVDGFTPDLRKAENRINMAILVKF